jgi:hypothetical protein
MADDDTLRKQDRDKLDRMGEAFDKIDRLLMALGLQGLQRMTATSVAELKALEMTAHNAALVNIERNLGVLATQVQRYVDKDPLFTMGDYAATLNRIWLLNNATRRRHAAGQSPDAMLDLIGEARRSYEVVSETLTLQPLGASGWVTDTDFVGITIYFFVDGKADKIYQASNCKPCMYFGRDPRNLMRDTISEHVAYSIYDMAHGAFEFRGAKVSHDGRLSLHKDLKVSQAPYLGARAYAALAVTNWIEAVERIRASEAHPVEGAGSTMVFVEPSAWGPLVQDEKTQRATIELTDDRGATMVLEVPMRAENNFLIDNLAKMLDRAHEYRRPTALFGRAFVHEGKLKLLPMTGIYNHAVVTTEGGRKRVNEVHLGLESLAHIRTGT